MNLAPRELPEDKYIWLQEILLALDCLINTLFRGWHHETVSSRSWRAWKMNLIFGKIMRPLADIIMIWQTWRMDHCQRHYDAEVARAELIVRARK